MMNRVAAGTHQISYEFLRRMPKVELHAHINGSVRKSTLLQIAERKNIQVDVESFERRDMVGGFLIFDLIHKLLRDIEDVRRVTRECLADFLDQNVCYLELRTTPKACLNGSYSQEQYVDAVLEEIQIFNSKNESQMPVRLLLSIDRSRSLEEAATTTEILLRKKRDSALNRILVGLDYSGNPIKNTFTDFQHFFKKVREAGLKTTVHIAEVPGEVCLRETKDIIDFTPDRLGHFSYFNSELAAQVKAKRIPIELCPTSNFYTNGLKNYSEHHFGEFFFENHPVNINTDDTGVFDTDSTEEFYKITHGFNLSKKQLYELSTTSTEIIFDSSQKERTKSIMDDYFLNNNVQPDHQV